MAKFPDLSAAAESLPLSIFARLYARLARFEGDVITFQVGDTCLPPPAAARLGALGFHEDHAIDLYSYSKPAGDAGLIDAVVDKVRRENAMNFVTSENVQITCGATHALSCAMRAVLDPGDEILLLAPYWPLIRGIARSVVVHPVEAPFSHVLLRRPEADAEVLLERFITPHTAALYMSNPNNPDGKVFSQAELAAVAHVAKRHDLWVISDEVYEFFTYDGRQHTSIATLPGMRERTITSFSFSKSYGLAGLRLGYVVGPRDAVGAVRKMSNHTVYNVPRAMQRAALAAIQHGDEFVNMARERYVKARDWAFDNIAAPAVKPQGSTYLFLDLSQWCDPDEDVIRVLERMADAGILLTPGGAFGSKFGKWARLCFTAVERARLEEGIERFNRVLETLS